MIRKSERPIFRKAEKPINGDVSDQKQKLLKRLAAEAGDNPYESEAHKRARQYIEERDLKLRAL